MGLLSATGKGATSLVDLIRKRFGDDVDGATQELVRMGGFPEPVARRIATGELPMDEASRVSRREAQAHPETYIHGSKSGGILEIDPEKSGATNPNARGSGFWGSDNPYQAGTYTGALGEGGTLYPFRVKRGEQIDVDLNGSHWNNIDTEARITSNGEDYGSIEGWDDSAYDTNDLAFMFQDAGADSLLMRNTIDTAADGNINVVFEEMFPELKKMPHGSKERYEFKKSISKEDFQKAKDIANERSARPSNNVAVFDENNIRSPSAAFDPQYTGPNIMGSAALPVAAGLLAAGQSEDSEAGPLTAAAKALLDKNFTESAVRSATDMAAAHKSREAITTMNIDEFLNLANPGFSPEKMDGLIGVDKFDEIPFLSMRNDNNGGAWITGHEGRHRARMLKAWGETEMPVRMRGNVRWDQQDSPDNFDYVEEWPSTLVSENGSVTTPFPFAQGDSNFLSSDGMALRSKYTPPKKAEPKPDSYDTEILADLLDEFNFEKGNADPRLLGGVAAGTAGLLAAGQSEDADASLASLAAKGLKIDTPDGKLFSVTQRGPEIGPAREIAYAEMEKNGLGGLSARDMAVTPEYRGDGLMGETYDAIEEYTGKNITPSSWLTDDGAKFWEKRDRNKASERGNADPRLLGGVAAGTAVGLAAPMVKDSGFISAPRSEGLMDLTMAARGLERRLEGSPASLLFPEGLVNYLETVNRRTEDPNAMTRIMGLVDLIP
jgi:hypothetical protein